MALPHHRASSAIRRHELLSGSGSWHSSREPEEEACHVCNVQCLFCGLLEDWAARKEGVEVVCGQTACALDC